MNLEMLNDADLVNSQNTGASENGEKKKKKVIEVHHLGHVK